jgi:hypothetical protein
MTRPKYINKPKEPKLPTRFPAFLSCSDCGDTDYFRSVDDWNEKNEAHSKVCVPRPRQEQIINISRPPRIVGSIYLIRIIGQDVYKIGYSRTPQSRIKSLQTSNPFPLEIIKIVSGTEPRESHLHKIAENHGCKRLKGEWFNIEKDSLNTILNEMDGGSNGL